MSITRWLLSFALCAGTSNVCFAQPSVFTLGLSPLFGREANEGTISGKRPSRDDASVDPGQGGESEVDFHVSGSTGAGKAIGDAAFFLMGIDGRSMATETPPSGKPGRIEPGARVASYSRPVSSAAGGGTLSRNNGSAHRPSYADLEAKAGVEDILTQIQNDHTWNLMTGSIVGSMEPVSLREALRRNSDAFTTVAEDNSQRVRMDLTPRGN